jgi:hypothetical protein
MSELLDKRKSLKTPEEEASLAEEFKIDVEILRSLARSVNSPSVDKAGIRPAPGSKGEDNLIATVDVIHTFNQNIFILLRRLFGRNPISRLPLRDVR